MWVSPLAVFRLARYVDRLITRVVVEDKRFCMTIEVNNQSTSQTSVPCTIKVFGNVKPA